MSREAREITVNQSKVNLIQGDITAQATDAIVNAANSSLMGGGGVDGAIHAAGGSAILEACREIIARQGHLPAGQAVITTAGNLKAKYVIHTVGPIWQGGSHREAALLASAYRESLKLAAARGLASVSFPSVSTGAYRYPLDEAAKIALETVAGFLKAKSTSLKEVVFVLYSAPAYQAYARALGEISRSL
ncbi:MAG: O-acetyl-ADP-ribose deacetylase [Chloroflexota bacterium]